MYHGAPITLPHEKRCYTYKIHICLPKCHIWITIYETYMFLFSWGGSVTRSGLACNCLCFCFSWLDGWSRSEGGLEHRDPVNRCGARPCSWPGAQPRRRAAAHRAPAAGDARALAAQVGALARLGRASHGLPRERPESTLDSFHSAPSSCWEQHSRRSRRPGVHLFSFKNCVF